MSFIGNEQMILIIRLQKQYICIASLSLLSSFNLIFLLINLSLLFQNQYYNLLKRLEIIRKMSNSSKLKNGKWGKVENDRFFKAIMKYGRNWIMIQKVVKSRTLSQIRSHAQKLFQIMPTQQLNHLDKQINSRYRYFCSQKHSDNQKLKLKAEEKGKKQAIQGNISEIKVMKDYQESRNSDRIRKSNDTDQQNQKMNKNQEQKNLQTQAVQWNNNNYQGDYYNHYGMIQSLSIPNNLMMTYFQNSPNFVFFSMPTSFSA